MKLMPLKIQKHEATLSRDKLHFPKIGKNRYAFLYMWLYFCILNNK